MSMARPIVASSCRFMHTMMNPTRNRSYSQKFQTSFTNPICYMAVTKNKAGFGFRGEPRSLFPYLNSTVTASQARRGFAVYSSNQQTGAPIPPSGSWRSWIAGIVMTIIVPFFTQKWSQLLLLKEEVDMVIETTEQIIDVVEEVAETVDKVAEDVADDLPEGGKLRNAVDFLEDVAEIVAKDAHTAGEFIDKFEEVEDKLEALIEPVMHQTEDVANQRR